jgi:hypothetical protein
MIGPLTVEIFQPFMLMPSWDRLKADLTASILMISGDWIIETNWIWQRVRHCPPAVHFSITRSLYDYVQRRCRLNDTIIIIRVFITMADARRPATSSLLKRPASQGLSIDGVVPPSRQGLSSARPLNRNFPVRTGALNLWCASLTTILLILLHFSRAMEKQSWIYWRKNWFWRWGLALAMLQLM